MENAGEVLRNFYAAVVKRDLAAARACLADDMVFGGLFQTYRSADEYMKTFAGLLQITVRLDVKKIIGEGNNGDTTISVFFQEHQKRRKSSQKILSATVSPGHEFWRLNTASC
jgi:hypothetical protein